MGLIISTGFFKYIPPEPKITALSSPTGNLGDVITVYGQDLDYVDNLYYANENLNFALIGDTQALQFVVPADPTTGQIEILTNSFPLTGNNKLNFLPIFKFDNFNPRSASEKDLISITGKVLTSIVSGFIYADPLIDDIDFAFTGEKNIFSVSTNPRTFLNNEIILVQNINTSGEILKNNISDILPFNFSSGKAAKIKYNKDILNQKYYENHIFSFPKITGTNIQTFNQDISPDYYVKSLNIVPAPNAFPDIFDPNSTFSTLTSTGIYKRDNINSVFTGRFQQVTLSRLSNFNIITPGSGYRINDKFNFYASGTLGTNTFGNLSVTQTGINGSLTNMQISDVGIFTKQSSTTGIEFLSITGGIGKGSLFNLTYQTYLKTGINTIFYSGSQNIWILVDAIFEGQHTYQSPNLQSWQVIEGGLYTGTSPSPIGSDLELDIDNNKKTYTIKLISGYTNTGYAPFYNIISDNAYDSYISDRRTGQFDITLNTALSGESKINGIILRTGQFIHDSGLYHVQSKEVSGLNTISFPINYKTESVNLNTNKLYSPYILTSFEQILGTNIGTSYVNANIGNLNNQRFDVNIYNPSNKMKLNYLAIINSGSNLSTFQYYGSGSFYKKIYLFTGDQNSFQERLKLSNLNIINKNNITFEVPETEYHINGKIELVNYVNLPSKSIEKFIETPKPTGVLPNKGIRGSNIIIQGKSFKKPILIDSTGEYNSCIVRFRYADDLYKQNRNVFETDFLIMNKNLLSGFIPIKNFPTGQYAIQMIAEDGSVFEE